MFNLLRMDLYRVKRSKSVYVCAGFLLLTTVLLFGLMWLLSTPRGQEIALRIGMVTSDETIELDSILKGVDSLIFFRQTCLDGGAYNAALGIWAMLFVCADFQGGFIKNIMALHRNRWNYIVSKVMTAWIVNFCYLVIHLLFTLLLNRLFGDLVPYAGWKDVLFYLSWVWFVTTAFAAMIICICVLTRSVAVGTAAAVLFGSGIIVMTLYGVLGMFHIGKWLEYSIYLTCGMGPGKYTSAKDLYVYAVGFGFLILYTVIAGIVLNKKDI